MKAEIEQESLKILIIYTPASSSMKRSMPTTYCYTHVLTELSPTTEY